MSKTIAAATATLYAILTLVGGALCATFSILYGTFPEPVGFLLYAGGGFAALATGEVYRAVRRAVR